MSVEEELRNRTEIMQKERAERIQACAETVSRYEAVRQMVTLPGWEIFAKDLEVRANDARKDFELLITEMYLNETPDLRERFISTKISLLAFEDAIHIYKWMREAAIEAKSILDKENVIRQD